MVFKNILKYTHIFIMKKIREKINPIHSRLRGRGVEVSKTLFCLFVKLLKCFYTIIGEMKNFTDIAYYESIIWGGVTILKNQIIMDKMKKKIVANFYLTQRNLIS